jgi:hypothetical protein
MSVILVASDPEVWRRPELSVLFDDVRASALETVLQDYDVVIPSDHMRQFTLVQRPDVRVALHCTDLDSLIYWRERGVEMDVIFAPSALALLEAEERTRNTLVLTKDRLQGELITQDCIATARGGVGLGEEYRELVTGMRALYPLKAGTGIDFGLVG